MTIIVEEALPFDLRILRSFRCLRPLKMVSKVPSKCSGGEEAVVVDRAATRTRGRQQERKVGIDKRKVVMWYLLVDWW